MANYQVIHGTVMKNGEAFVPGDTFTLSPDKAKSLLAQSLIKAVRASRRFKTHIGKRRGMKPGESLREIPINIIDGIRADALRQAVCSQFDVSMPEIRKHTHRQLVEVIIEKRGF